MTNITITDTAKQKVITRLATIKSATSILSLINGRPAKVSVDEVLTLAERIEQWAWRDLLEEPLVTPEATQPEPDVGKSWNQPQPNGSGQHAGEASERQINAIFAIARSKGCSNDRIKSLVSEKLGKPIQALSGREASKLIDNLRAL